MYLGIRAHDIPIFDDIPSLAKRLNDLQFDYIQFAPRVSLQKKTETGENVSFGLANQVKWEFAKYGIQIAVLGCYVNIIHPDITKRESAISQFKDYLARANSFGTVLVGTETGSVDPDFHLTSDNYRSEIVKLAIQQVRKMVTIAEKIGCLVGIEPGVNHPIHNLEITEKLIKEIQSPNLKIILDAANLVTPESTAITPIIQQALTKFGKQIYAFHLKDYVLKNGRIHGVPVGEGIADLQSALTLIQRTMPAAYTILDETPQDHFMRSINRFKQMADA